MRFDDGSKQFEFQTRKLNPKERSKIEHEINTNYSKYENQELCIHYSFALDNKCYKYYFENHGTWRNTGICTDDRWFLGVCV